MSGIPTINEMFENAMKRSGAPEMDPGVLHAMRSMFFSGAACMLHINNQIAEIGDDFAAVAELAKVGEEVHRFALASQRVSK